MTWGMRFRPRHVRSRNRRIPSRAAAGGGGGGGRVVLARAGVWLAGIAALAGAGYGACQGFDAALTSERLRVRHIDVVGNRRASSVELGAYAGVEVGAGLLELDLDEIALQLRRHPWIDTARVRRQLPDRLVIEVREHVPVVLVSLGDLYLANAEGRLFKRFAASDGIELPVVTGLTREQVARAPEQTAARIREAAELQSAVEARGASVGRLEELHHDSDLGWSALMGGTGEAVLTTVRLHLGGDPLGRLDTALAAVARARELGARPAAVFADGKKSPGRVQVRLRRPPEAEQRTLVATAR